MPINYSRLNATATRLLRENGKNIILRHSEIGVYDVNTGTASDVVTEQTAKAVQVMWGDNEIDGTNVLSTDIKLMVEPNITEPKINDICVLDGNSYTVKNYKQEKPALIVMYYYLQLRA
jgi:hypothetical protein